jgi:hypothetical protein
MRPPSAQRESVGTPLPGFRRPGRVVRRLDAAEALELVGLNWWHIA